MADKLKKNQRILNSEWDDETLSYFDKVEERRRLEDEKRAQEERIRQETAAARTTSLDEFGSIDGMREALAKPTTRTEPEAAPQEEAPEITGGWDAFRTSGRGSDDLTDSAAIQEDLGNLITKYHTPQQREAARQRLEQEKAIGLMDRSTFSNATRAAEELAKIDKAEELFSTPGKVEEMQAKMLRLKASGKAQSQAAETYFKDNNAKFARTSADMWNSRLSALPVATGLVGSALGPVGTAVGAGLGAIPGAKQAYNMAYVEGADAGMSEEEAREFAAVMAASEYALDAAGGAGTAVLSGVFKREAKKRVTDTLKKAVLVTVAKQAAVESVSEGATSAIQMGIRAGYAQNEELSKVTRDYLNQAAHVNPDGTLDFSGAVEEISRAMLAGGTTTGIITTPVETLAVMKEMGKQAHFLEKHLNDQKKNSINVDVTNSYLFPPDNNTTYPSFEEQQAARQRELEIDAGLSVGRKNQPVDAGPTAETIKLRQRAENLRSTIDNLESSMESGDYSQGTLGHYTNAQRELQQVEASLRDSEAASVPPKLRPGTVQSRMSPPMEATEPTQGVFDFPEDPEVVKANKEAQKLVADKEKALAAAEKRRAKAEENKVKDRIVTESLKLPPEARAPFVRDKLQAWRDSRTPKGPTQQATTSTPTPTAPLPVDDNTPSIPFSSVEKALQDAPRSSVALPSLTPEGGTGVTLDDVSKAVGGGKRDRLASRLSYMIQDGNLEIVQDQSQLPEGMVEQDDQGRGWYDPNTGKLYVVAGNLNKANVRGDVLSVLAHETKHGGDFGGDAIVGRSFSKFIGAEANLKLGDKIRTAAKSGDKSAQAALNTINQDTYQKRGLTKDQLASELTAAYISHEHNKKGVRTALYRAVVNPLWTGAKQFVGADLSVKDIHYMADKWVQEVASKGERFQPSGSGVALPMIMGQAARRFPKAQEQNRVYTSKDGSKRFVISDKNSEIDPRGISMLANGDEVELGDILKHYELYANYPRLEDRIKVVPAPVGADYGAMALGSEILIPRDTLALGMLRPAEFRSILLHEVQHMVQDGEGHSPGGTTEDFYTKKDRAAIKKSVADKATLKLEASSLTLPVVTEAVSPEDAASLETLRKDIKSGKLDPYSGMVDAVGILSSYQDRGVVNLTTNLLGKIQTASDSLYAKITIEQKATESYLNMLGETDARFTQHNADVPLDELPINPETGYNENVTVYEQQYAPAAKAMPNAVEQANKKAVPMPSIADDYVPRELPVARTITRTIKLKDGTEATLSSKPGKWEGTVEIIARVGGKEVGSLDATTAEQDGIRFNPHAEVDSAWRRKGLASAMYDLAEEAGALIPHMSQKGQVRTPDGEAFRQAREAKKAKPMPSLKDSMGDGDRRSWWGKKKDGNKYIRSISNVLSSSQGYGEQVFQMLSDRGGARIVLAYQAERLAADMRDGVVAAAKAQGVTNKVINEQLRTKIDEINALPSKEARDIAIKNLDKKYPGLGTALIGLRELKWALATAVISQRKAEGRDLTIKEHNIINRMLENQETWTTRVYESGQLNSKDLANRKLARMKANPTSEEAVQFAEDVDTLFTKYVKIPSEDVLLTMDPKDLRRYYATWKGDPEGVAPEVMVQELTKLSKKPDEAFQKKLLAVRDELMGRSKAKTSTVRGFAGARQNRTVLEGREKVPPEIRRLMGEITDPVAREVLSVARLSSLYTQNQLLQKLADTTQGILWQDHSTGDFSQEIKGENYGPMRGKFVTPAGLRVIQPVVDMGMETDDAIVNINEDGTVAIGRAFATTANGVQKVAGATKLVSLIWNLGAAGMNYMGAYGALMSNGIGFSKIKDAQVLTTKAIRARYQPNLYTGETQKNIEELLIGNVMDSATTGEYQQRLFSTIFKDMDKDATPKDVKRKVKELLHTGVLVSKDVYAFADMWAKVAAWQGRVDYLTELYKVEGTNKSRNDILREAGHDITAANISWSRAPIAVKAVEKYLGPLAMFFVYFAEVPRSTAYSLALAYKDFTRAGELKTAEGKAIARDAGIRRFVGTMGYIAAISGTMAWYLNGMEDDEERRRKTDPEWEQKGFNLPVGMTKDGKLITYNFLRGDFIGPLNEVLVKLATQDDDDTTAKIMKEYITDQFVKNRILFSFMRLSKSLLGLETENFDDNAGELADRLDQLSWGDDNNLGRNLMDFVEKASPATPRGIVKTANGSVGDGYSFDPATNPAVAIIQSLGLKPSVRDPETSLTFAASRYNKAKSEATGDLTTLKKRYSKMDAAAVINDLEDIIQDERDAFKDVYEVYDGTVAFNGYYTDKDYAKAAADIIESKKLGKVGADLKSGVFNLRFIPKDLPSKWREARLEYIKTLPTDKKSKASADLRVEYAALKDYLNSRSK